MQILSVELDNIKSYRRARIDLTPGINAICGHNGSGKTTILEAIGYALFDYLPYNQQAFIREGEKTGTVRVRLLGNDAREYEVVRRVGGAQYYVADIESGTRLAERGPNVLEWIRAQAFGLEEDADLEALFKNAVGVPQGLMTSDFLGTTNARKAVFDPLLRVEEYNRAWEKLRDTMSSLRDRSAAVREEIARLETDVQRIPSLEDQREELQRRIDDSEAAIAVLVAAAEDVEQGKQILDSLRTRLDESRNLLRDAEYAVGIQEGQVQRREEALAAASAARDIVAKTEASYRLVEESKVTLHELETRRQARDGLLQQKTEASAHMRGIQKRLESLDQQRAQAIADGSQAAALAPDVEHQALLEEQLREAQAQIREHHQLATDLGRRERAIADLERSIKSSEQRLEEARAARTEADRLPTVQQNQADITGRLGELRSLRPQLQPLHDEGKRLRVQHDALQADVERASVLRRRRGDLGAQMAELEPLRVRVSGLRNEEIRLTATLEYQRVARVELERHTCPLLEIACPVVSADVRTLQRFDDSVAAWNSRVHELCVELDALNPRLERAEAAASEVQTIDVELARLEAAERELPLVAEGLERCRREYQELSRVLSDVPRLEGELRNLDAEAGRLQALAQLAAHTQVLEEQLARDRESLKTMHVEYAELRARADALAGASHRLDETRRELDGLDDPRSRQQKLLGTAGQVRAIEAELEGEQTSLQEESDRLRALVASLQPFEGLDEELERVRRRAEEHHEGYERYLQHWEEATQVEARQEDVRESRVALDAARSAAEHVTQSTLDLEGEYDDALHQELTQRYHDLHRDLGVARNTHDHLLGEMNAVEKDLAFYQRREETLRAEIEVRGELERTDRALQFIRETIKAAGPAVTESLLSNISLVANDIYAEIMDDHSIELRWERDYDVLVRRGAEDRKFAQLSGGEQMSAALAVRLALLKEMSDVDVAFFDEPTQNMDVDRRSNLASQIRAVRGFNQLIVISHDDTFEHHTDNLIRLEKDADETRVVA